MMKFLKTRAFRQGAAATALTAIAVALVIVLNMVVTALSDRYPLSVDLTEEKLFGISGESRDFLKTLDKDITIYVLSTEEAFLAGNSYAASANEVIKRYSQESERVKVEYIDLLKNPAFEGRYPDLQLSPNSILITSGDKVRDLTPYDLYNVQSYEGQSYIASSKAEQAMTSAMLNVTSGETVKAVFITGHDESAMPGFEALLELNNYEVSSVNLMTENIPGDAEIAIMAAPKRDLGEDELKRLDDYLSNGEKLGKTLLYFASAEQPESSELTNLSAFLKDWGVEVGESVVFESSLNMVSAFNLYATFANYAEAEYSEPTAARQLLIFVPFAKPLGVLFESKSSITTVPLLSFSETSGVVPKDATNEWQPSESDLSGPIPALVLAQKLDYEGTEAMRSNVVVCASAFSAADDAISSTSTGNGDYFINLLNKLSEREDIVNIQSKAITNRELGITSETALALALIFVILLPLAVLACGVVMWLRRRHK